MSKTATRGGDHWSDYVEPAALPVVDADAGASWLSGLVPLFPLDSFTPASKCPHHGPIRPGSLFCCMVCSASGMDGHPSLRAAIPIPLDCTACDGTGQVGHPPLRDITCKACDGAGVGGNRRSPVSQPDKSKTRKEKRANLLRSD